MGKVIGIDPDAEKHGVAVYENGKLIDLCMMTTVEIIMRFAPLDPMRVADIKFSIENVMANQFVYSRNVKASKSAQSKVAMHIGRCQQAQVELMRWLDHYEFKYALHKPQKGNWSDKRMIFENATGWTKQSNADTRSAAYFGFLELKNEIK
jgi:hypothetical protein